MLIYRKIKIEKTTPTIKTTNAPTIPPTVTGRFVDVLWGKSIDTVPVTK